MRLSFTFFQEWAEFARDPCSVSKSFSTWLQIRAQVGTDGEKNIDWIDTDNRLTVKKTSIRLMVFRRKKNLEPMVQFYRKNKFFFWTDDRYYWSKMKNF